MNVRTEDTSSLGTAVSILRDGGVVAFPTETVYGLGADATQDKAIAKVFAIKGRPAFNPLIVHIGGPEWVHILAVPDDRIGDLTRTFWPGPLTIILKQRPDSPIAPAVSGGLETIALRQPDHPVATKLLAMFNRPIAAPSANLSGRVSPTTAAHVNIDLGNQLGHQLDMIIDGGACLTGIESTVLDMTGDKARILRPGSIDASSLSDVIGTAVEFQDKPVMQSSSILSPGQLAKHYAPSLPVRLNVSAARSGEALIGFGFAPSARINLSVDRNLSEAAAALFGALRTLDQPKLYNSIGVMPIPNEGLGRAINNRLERAAAD